MTGTPLIERCKPRFIGVRLMDPPQRAVVLCEQVDYQVERIRQVMSYLHVRCMVPKPAFSHPFVNLVSAGTKFIGSNLVAPRVLVVIGTDLLVAVKADRDAIVLVVGAASGFVDDVSGFNVYPALLVAQTTAPIASDEHRRLYGSVERHGVSTVGNPISAIFRRRTVLSVRLRFREDILCDDVESLPRTARIARYHIASFQSANACLSSRYLRFADVSENRKALKFRRFV